MSHQDLFLRFSGSRLPFPFRPEVGGDPGQDIGNIRFPLPEVFIGDGIEDFLILPVGLGKGPLHPGLFLPDASFYAGKERAVLQDKQMGIENKGVLFPHTALNVFFQEQELILCPFDRSFQPSQLALHGRGRDGLFVG